MNDSSIRDDGSHDALLLVFEQANENMRAVWEFYFRFHTVFLTINIAGLGIFAKYAPADPTLVAVVFILFGALAAITAARIECETMNSAKHLHNLAVALGLSNTREHKDLISEETVMPRTIALWGARANFVASVILTLCWIYIVLSEPSSTCHLTSR